MCLSPAPARSSADQSGVSFGFELSACLAALTAPLRFPLALHGVVSLAEPLEVRQVVAAAFFVGCPVVEFEGAGAWSAVSVLA